MGSSTRAVPSPGLAARESITAAGRDRKEAPRALSPNCSSIRGCARARWPCHGRRDSPPQLAGTVGPGFTISLKSAGKKVATLKHGKYTFKVGDKSTIHNFTLNGPGQKNTTITATGFVGTKTATLTLKKGGYRFYCTVHPSITGTFKVS